MIASVLALLLTLTLSSEAQSSGRYLSYGQGGPDANNSFCYILSAKYATVPNGVVGDVVVAAMGENISFIHAPWTTVGYVSGAGVDLGSTQNQGLDQLNRQAANLHGGVAAWAYYALVEFCDQNNQEGYQRNSADTIINTYYSFFSDFTQTCGNGTDPVSGKPVFYSQVMSEPAPGASNSNFLTSCFVFPSDQSRLGSTVSPYSFKCDVHIDYSNLWAPLTTCPDSKRKIGIALTVVAATFDTDVTNTDLNANSQFSLNSQDIVFKWDNFYRQTSSLTDVSSSASQGTVTATYLQDDNITFGTWGAGVSHRIFFAFDAAKSSGKNYFYWDPTTTVQTGTSSMTASLVLLLLSLYMLL